MKLLKRIEDRPVNPPREYLGAEVQARHAQEREDAPAVDPEAAFWDVVNIVALDGEQERMPALLEREDGHTVIYANRDHVISGDPGTGKSWLALIAAKATVAKGGRVFVARL